MYIVDIFHIEGRGVVVALIVAKDEDHMFRPGEYILQGKHRWKLVTVAALRYMKTLDLEEVTGFDVILVPVDDAPERPEKGECVKRNPNG